MNNRDTLIMPVYGGCRLIRVILDRTTQPEFQVSLEDVMAVKPPEVAPNGTAEKPKRQRPVAPPAPAGLTSLSSLRNQKDDAYAPLRQLVGKWVVFTGVNIADDKKSGTATVYPYVEGADDATNDAATITIPIPKAAIKMIVKAVQEGKTDGLAAYVQQTARGVALI